jgi:tRNA A-37 threonylcarbamoyl transferase component Bud32
MNRTQADAPTRRLVPGAGGSRQEATEPTRIVPDGPGAADRLDQHTLERALQGRYRVECELGAGGMGQVFRGLDPALDRAVALKTIRREILADPHWLDRFRLEATVSAAMQHPNIVQVYEILDAADRPVLVMEYAEGGDLRSAVRAGQLGQTEAVRIMASVCSALAFAHAHGVIHRDIKPGNIMLGPNGEAKVTDFGLATQLGRRASALIDAEETGSTLGSPAYMSPEQARGDVAALDNRADIYSLGATLYFALTGRPPVRGRDVSEVLERVAAGRVRPPSQLRPGLDRDLEAICLKAMAEEPEERYASAALMARDLRNFLQNRPVLARHYGPWETLRRAAVARRGVLATGVAAVVLAFAGIATAAITMHSVAKSQVFEGMRAQVMDLANTAVLLIDAAEVRAQMARIDAGSPVARGLSALLTQVRRRSPHLRYVWIMRRSGEGPSTLEFVADSLPPETADHQPGAWTEAPARPGDRFDASPFPELLRGFQGPAADRRYAVTDRWGIALSGYAPIKDEAGRAIAVLGVDMSRLDVAARFVRIERALLATLLLSAALSVLGLVLLVLTVMGQWSRQRFNA